MKNAKCLSSLSQLQPVVSYSNLTKLSFILLFLLVIPLQAFADWSYGSGSVKFEKVNDSKVKITCFTQDYYGYDDELDDITYYYLDPTNNTWVKFFRGDMDDSNRWDCHEKISGVDHSTSYTYKSSDNHRWSYIYYTFPSDLFNNNIIFKVEYDWDIDSDQSNAGNDGTLYYNYSGATATPWADFWETDYDYINNQVNFKFLICDIYGDGVVGSAYQKRHELDDIYIEYFDGTWKEIVHGDCDNYATDTQFEIFSSTSNGTITRSTERVGSSKIYRANVVWKNIPEDILDNGDVKFRYRRDYDLNADQTNAGIESTVEFTHTLKEKKNISRLYLDYDTCANQVNLSWYDPESSRIEGFYVDKSKPGNESNPWSSLGSTFERLDINKNTTYSDTDIEHGKIYVYRVLPIYKDGSTKVADPSTPSILVEVDAKPTQPNNFKASPTRDSEGTPGVEISWDAICSNASEIILSKKNNKTGEVQEITLNTNETSYLDLDIKACVIYSYKLIAKNEYGFRSTIYADVVVSEEIDNALTSFEGSKGYFTNKVVLEWTCDKKNLLDYYMIYRKRYGTNMDSSIITVTANSKVVAYVDESADPGVYYQYFIQGYGECENNEVASNIRSTIGFRQPVGTVSGQVNYEGGSPVPNVRVALEMAGSNDVLGSCIQFDGTGMLETSKTLSLAAGFTAEMWVAFSDNSDAYTLFDKWESETGFKLSYTNNNQTFTFKLGSETATFQASDLLNEGFNHIAIENSGNTINLYLNGQLCSTQTHLYKTNKKALVIAEGFKGKIDEIRLWNQASGTEQIAQNYNRMLTGQEEGLVGYWRLDEKLGKYAFDISKYYDKFNNNHATLTNATWTEEIPSVEQLALCGITDENGNYLINGVRYSGAGESFKITPMYGQHSFDPNTRSVFIGDGSLIQNNQNFEDISSFPINGLVKYDNSNYPVKDAFIKVDGKIVVGEDQMPVMSGSDGQFTVRVPIGEHYISIEKHGHYFENPYFPARNESGEISYHDFQKSLDGTLTFIDTTKVKLIGRVVGGLTEGDKKLHFGKSKNNIGQATITLEAAHDLDTLQQELSRIKTISTSAETGEYYAWLLPEKYTVTSVKTNNKKYTFDVELYGNTIDLSNTYITQYIEDSVFAENYLEDGTIEKVFTDSIATYAYNQRKSWTYREDPIMKVEAIDGSPYFYDKTIQVGVEEVSILDEEGNHAFGFPLLTFDKNYIMDISVVEPYVNPALGSDSVYEDPVKDGVININTDIALHHNSKELELSEDGSIRYSFRGGFPNIAEDSENEEHNYTKTMSISVRTGAGKFAYWPSQDEEFRAYVLGGRPTGNNFVTTGPNEIDFILRDPAGSNSYAYLEKGFTSSKTTSFSWDNGQAGSETVTAEFGVKVETVTGAPGCMLSTEVASNNSAGITVEHEENWSKSNEKTTSTTISSTYTTSDDPAYVGSMGDVFIGHATNIIYGLNRMLEPMLTSEVVGGLPDIGKTFQGKYTIAQRNALRVSPEFATMFVYTQNHIQNYLIPNLEKLRNLQFQNNPDEYRLNFTDTSDEKYGTNNDDPIWGSLQVDKSPDNPDAEYDGASYTFTAKSADDPNWHEDSVRFYNLQIQLWEDVLKQNEKEKLRAVMDNNHKNISFDAGTTYESSIETSTEEAHSKSYEWTIAPGLCTEIGFSVNNTGMNAEIEERYTHSENTENTNTEETTQNVGFVLADGDQGDYYTVDVKKCIFGNGPVFSVRGGQSACPYEGEELTQYYRAGNEVLNHATMRVEAPTISADQTTISGIPETHPATYTLKLGNETEADADNWYMVSIDAESNPNGAKLKLDGAAIVNGVSVLVPANTTITKTLELWKGEANDYENINIVFHSLCQFDPTDDIEDIADTVSVSAYFIPACSEINVAEPNEGWLVNYASKDTLPIKLNGYNAQLSTFKQIDLQYKAKASSQWITLNSWFKDESLYDAYSGSNKALLNGKTELNYEWDMTDLPDRDYQLRAKTFCLDESVYATDPLNGTLDGQRPNIFGTPQPADGILSSTSQISIRFDEPIDEGLLSSFNFQLKGVLNNSALNHGTSLLFDGTNADFIAGDGLQLANKSFTIEFWIKADSTHNGAILSYINGNSGLSLSFDNGEFLIKQEDTETQVTVTTKTVWRHYAFAFDAQKQLAKLYEDSKEISALSVSSISSDATLIVGDNNSSNSFKGNIHDLRVWSKALPLSSVVSNMSNVLSGYEIGLSGYWPMDEGYGSTILDKASSRHGSHTAQWKVDPDSKSYSFTGSNALSINTGTLVFDDETNYTVEFWFKTATKNGTLISNATNKGITEGTLEVLIENGVISATANETELTSSNDYTDNNWHHFALVVNRRSNASLYIDGNKESEVKGNLFGSFYGAALNVATRKNNDGIFSDFFNGNIDEIRIWSTDRSQELLEMYRNTRLSGEEPGLKAYFPFEKYTNTSGIFLSTETLSDQSIDPYSETGSSNCGNLSTIGTISYSDNSPNIKRENPRTDVSFSFTSNGDEVIITPTAPQSTLEKAILEITAIGVEDLHGNRLASPVTWTAYVDQNSVKWIETEVALEKDANNAVTFEVEMQNTGGTYENFSIDNLPSWLSASPSSGVIGPNTTKEIEFEIHSGLNIGAYNSDIYLHTDFGFDEKLNVSVRVKGEEPDWSVDASQFASSMSFIGRLQIDGSISNDRYDKIGVFNREGDCRGVSYIEYFPSVDDYLVMLVVYGNTEGEALSYKVYDASTGKVFTSVTPNYSFSAQKLYGRSSAPILFECGATIKKEIPLNAGWSWISFNTTLDNYADLNELLQGIDLNVGDRITSGGATSKFVDNTLGWLGAITKPEVGKLYRCYIKDGGTINYNGTAVKSSDYTLTVDSGWNRLGFIPQINIEINEALSAYAPDVDDVIKGQLGFAIYNGFNWFGSLKYLEPNKGYKLYRNAAETTQFSFPENSTFSTKAAAVSQAKLFTDAYKFETSTSVLAKLQNVTTTENATIEAYINGELRGVSLVSDNYQFLTIFGESNNSGEQIDFVLNNDGQKTQLKGNCAFGGEQVVGTIEEPLMLGSTSTALNTIDESLVDLSVYPNPFSNQLSIQLNLREESDVQFSITNALGQVIYNSETEILSPGKGAITWNSTSLETGIYTLQVVINNQVKTLTIHKSN